MATRRRLVRWSGISDPKSDLCYKGPNGYWDVMWSPARGRWILRTPTDRSGRAEFWKRVHAQRNAERQMCETGEIDLITRIGKLA